MGSGMVTLHRHARKRLPDFDGDRHDGRHGRGSGSRTANGTCRLRRLQPRAGISKQLLLSRCNAGLVVVPYVVDVRADWLGHSRWPERNPLTKFSLLDPLAKTQIREEARS
jgi:hypothetical protein